MQHDATPSLDRVGLVLIALAFVGMFFVGT